MSGLRKAVILCAGYGSRLMPLTAGTPKVMLPVAGRPLLEHHVLHLAKAGLTDLCINLHAHPEAIERHLGDGSRFGVRIHYAFEPDLRGTAGALNGFRELLDERFLVLYGDVYSELNIAKLAAFHERLRPSATLAVHPSFHPEDSDIVALDGNSRIIGLHHKPGSSKYGVMGNAGCYLVEPAALPFVPEDRPSDFIQDVFSGMLAGGLRLYGYQTGEILFDMGTPERYRMLQERLIRT